MISSKMYSLLIVGTTILSNLFSSIYAEATLAYPACQRVGQIDQYHGTEVADPYRHLEDASLETTQQWIREQSALTFDYLSQIPQREAIRKKIEALCNYEKHGNVFFHGDRYFLSKNDGLQNQFVIYTVKHLGEQPEVLLDPNLLSEDGTTALGFYEPSPDATWIAYGLTKAGSDWEEIKIRHVKTKEDLQDSLKWIKFSAVTWHPDGKGFYYCRYDAPSLNKEYDELTKQQRIYFHHLETDQTEDELIYENSAEKENFYRTSISDDKKFLIITASKDAGEFSSTKVFLKELNTDAPLKELFQGREASFSYIGNQDSLYWFLTNYQANNQKVIGLDLAEPTQWKEVIPEAAEALISVDLVGERFVAHYLKNAHSHIQIFQLDGTFEKTLYLASIGTTSGFSGKKSSREAFYTFTSFTQPTATYRYDFITGESTLLHQPQLAVDPNDYETQQVMYQSKDGTSIPMFLSFKKGMKLDGNNPVLLYGYGGFEIPITPSFAPSMLVWMDMGGIYAVANLRGGGEFGKTWHDAGRLANKQNVFDDFIAAAEWLIDQNYTSTAKLAINGASNGGLLVGACLNQRPDLFGAAIPAVGVMDMLRFHKFTVGWCWTSEYGSPDNSENFAYLYPYSPLHNIKNGVAYPPTLILTGEKDDRVVPAHSYKYAATLQEAQSSSAPILIRIETAAGHGAGKPLSKSMDEKADMLAFLVHHLNMEAE